MSQKSRKSNSTIKKIINDIETSESPDSEYSNYVDYVKNLQERNKHLENEICVKTESVMKECEKVKQVYNDQINTLRKTINQTKSEKNNLMYQLNNAKSELSICNSKLTEKSEMCNNLQRVVQDQQITCVAAKTKMEEFKLLKQEFDELNSQNSKNLLDLSNETRKRLELEAKVNSLLEEIEFYKDLNKSLSANQDTSTNTSMITYDDKLNELEEQFESLKSDLQNEYKEKEKKLYSIYQSQIQDLTTNNKSLVEKQRRITDELKSVKIEQHEFRARLVDKESEISVLKNRLAQCSNTIAQLKEEYENQIHNLKGENEDLSTKCHEKTLEIQTALNNRVLLEQELFTLKSRLQADQFRNNLPENPISRKRRNNSSAGEGGSRSDSSNEYVITAWSNGKLKVGCEEKFAGDFVWLLNDSNNDVDINEWTLEFTDENERKVEYVFAPRIIKRYQKLNVWSCDKEHIEDDDNNLVLTIQLPTNCNLFCRLTNDMAENEASFQLRKMRPILKRQRMNTNNNNKTNVDNKECSIM